MFFPSFRSSASHCWLNKEMERRNRQRFSMKPLPFILHYGAHRIANVVFFKQKQLLTTSIGMHVVLSASLLRSTSLNKLQAFTLMKVNSLMHVRPKGLFPHCQKKSKRNNPGSADFATCYRRGVLTPNAALIIQAWTRTSFVQCLTRVAVSSSNAPC